MTEATAQSVNTAYAQVVDLLGAKKVTAIAEQAGGWKDLPQVCSIALGTAPVTPLEMARAFSTFAARGQRPDPLAVTKVVTPAGRILFQRSPHREQVMDAHVADTVNRVLTQVIDHGTAAGKGIGRPAAGKTGTTDNQVDAWFAGYTPKLTAAVWVGFPPDPATGRTPAMTNVRGGPVTGGSVPATIWQRFMKDAVAGTPPASFVEPQVTGRVTGPTVPCSRDTPSAGQTPCPRPRPTPSASPACADGGPVPVPLCPSPSGPSSPVPPTFLTSSPWPLPLPSLLSPSPTAPVLTPPSSPSPKQPPSPSPTPFPSPTPSPSPTPTPTPPPRPTPTTSP